jgi:CHAT domain-containing protein
MKRLLPFVAALLLAQLSGCATMLPEHVRLETTARYDELADMQEARGGDSARELYKLCYAYSKIKDYAKLFACADKLEQRIKAGDTQVVLFSGVFETDGSPAPHLLRAEAYIELGQYPAAIEQATAGHRLTSRVENAAFGIEKTQHTIHALGLLALAHALNGDLDESAIHLKMLDDLPIPFGGSAQSLPMKHRAIARVHMSRKEFAKALAILHRYDAGFARSLGSVFFLAAQDDLFATLELPKAYMIAKCLLETGATAEATQRYDRLLDDPRLPQLGEFYWLILADRGRIAAEAGNAKTALDYLARAIEVIEHQRASIRTEANKIGFVGDKQAVYRQLVSLLIRHGDVEEAFGYVERAKSRALVDMLASQRNFSSSQTDKEAIRRILVEFDELDRDATTGKNAAPASAATVTRRLHQARREIHDLSPELASLVTVGAVPIAELQRMLGDDDILVEYYYHDSELHAFVLDSANLRVVPLEANALEDDIRSFRQAIELIDTPSWREPSRRLHARLWAPLSIAARGKDITVVAHGALHYLPFAALEGEDGGLLIERHKLRFLPSASVLKYLRPPLVEGKAALLAIGNPDLGDPAMSLKFAEQEAGDVAGLFPDARVLLRRDATETNFRKAGASFARIHFAMHGRFHPETPLSSGLYLAGDAENDGLLTVGELYSMSIDADLVTLSACETGLGKIGNGDDVIGLTRGFLYAGSRSIVASLWSVDDKATALLMRSFYKSLSHAPKHDALRQAQLEARQRYPHPFYWAAFQLTGRTR